MLALVLLAGSSLATRPELQAHPLQSPPAIDGRLDDAAWQAVRGSQRFTQKLPVAGAEPSELTTLQVAFDADALYVAFDCVQERTPIVQRLTRRDHTGLADAVFIAVGSRADGRSAFEFSINAAGVLSDAVRFDDTELAPEWDENWQAQSALTPRGWSAEFRVPLRILRFRSGGEAWDFQARRFVAGRQEWLEWSYIPRGSAGEVSQYGRLLGVREPEESARFELRPFLLAQWRRQSRAERRAPSSPASLSAGGDLKYHPSQSLTLDATINPDFAAIEADREVLNLGNTESFLPEKRAFFLEGGELFSTPLDLFYSRRIGRAVEPPPALGADDFGQGATELLEPSRIYGASKLSGALGGGWSIGLLQALTAPNRLDVAWSDGRRARRVLEPLTAYGVLRLRRDLSGGAHAGALLTATRRLEQPQGNGLARICPNGELVGSSERCFNDAYVTSLDLRWPSSGAGWFAAVQLVQSVLHGGPPRRLPDGSVLRTGSVGQGAFAQLVKQAGDITGDLNFEFASADLDYGDLGYSSRSNLYSWSANVEFRDPRPSDGWIESWLRFEYLSAFNLDGLDLGTTFRLGAHGKLFNRTDYELYLHYFPAYLDDRETGDGLALERASRAGFALSLASDPSRAIGFELSTLSQWIEGGAAFEGSATLALRPWPAFALELGPQLTHTLGEPRHAGQLESGDYVFGNLRASSLSAVVHSSYGFFPELSLEAYGQVFLAAGHYSSPQLYELQGSPAGRAVRLADLRAVPRVALDNPDFVEGKFELRLMLHWEFVPGSTLYAVYRHSRQLDAPAGAGQPGRLSLSGLAGAPAVDSLTLKLALWWGS